MPGTHFELEFPEVKHAWQTPLRRVERACASEARGVARPRRRLAFQHCIMSLCSSSYSDLGLQLITDLLSLRSSSYWLVRTELLETLAEVDFRYVHQLGYLGTEHREAWAAWCRWSWSPGNPRW